MVWGGGEGVGGGGLVRVVPMSDVSLDKYLCCLYYFVHLEIGLM